MSGLMHLRYDIQLREFHSQLGTLLELTPEGRNRDMIDYLAHIIELTSDFNYKINGKFLKLFVEHYSTELLGLRMQSLYITNKWYPNSLIGELGPIDKKDAFKGILSYLSTLQCELGKI
jgi:hypothetical protein